MRYIFLIIIFLEYSLHLRAQTYSSKVRYVLVLDPGHGGKDPGKLRSSSKYKNEKEINLRISLLVGKYIERSLPVKVIYTRKNDKNVSLDQRVMIANKQKADFFISIHCNSNPSKKIHGTVIHIHHHNFKVSKRLAVQIDRQFEKRARRFSRGVRDKDHRGINFQVLQYTNMPSVLVEVGFLSNSQEERYLNSNYGQDIIASAIFRAFRAFLKLPPRKKYTEDRQTYYKVQIFASRSSQKNNPQAFAELPMSQVEEHMRENHPFKYYYTIGREYEYRSAKKLLRTIKKTGFEDAFVVKFSNGKRVK